MLTGANDSGHTHTDTSSEGPPPPAEIPPSDTNAPREAAREINEVDAAGTTKQTIVEGRSIQCTTAATSSRTSSSSSSSSSTSSGVSAANFNAENEEEEREEHEEDVRPGSPIQHRRVRGVAPIPHLDLEKKSNSTHADVDSDYGGLGAAVGISALDCALIPLSTHSIMLVTPQPQQQQHSGQRDNVESTDNLSVQAAVRPEDISVSLPNSDSDGRLDGHYCGGDEDDEEVVAAAARARSRANKAQHNTSNDINLEVAATGMQSPVPVTLLGVENDLRRKRIKKVSNYILGPLLGEGVYGVVRDALDVSGEHVTRCAVKMVAVSGGRDEDEGDEHTESHGRCGGNVGGRSRSKALQEELCDTTSIPHGTEDDQQQQQKQVDGGDGNGSAGPALHVGLRRQQTSGKNSNNNHNNTGNSGGGLKRCTRDSFVKQVFELESMNLQRFHNTHVIRAMDIFSRYGKQYVVLPIANCSLEQLIDETEELLEEEEGAARAHEGRPARPDVSVIPAGEVFEDDEALPSKTTTASSSSTTRTIDSDNLLSRPLPQHGRRKSHTRPTANSTTAVEFGGGKFNGQSSESSRASSPILDVASANTDVLLASQCSRPEGGQTLLHPQAASSAPPTTVLHAGEKAVPPSLSSTSPSLLPAMLIKGILFQVLSGLHYLHKQNLAHNDVKPPNILLFESGTVKLTDLGSIGEYFNDKGTPLFASPELCKQFFGIGDADDGELSGTNNGSCSRSSIGLGGGVDAKQCDMWCCGLVLYYLITGRTGPLPVHVEADRRRLEATRDTRKRNDFSQHPQRHPHPHPHNPQHGGAAEEGSPSQPMQLLTRFQVYREIASQKTPISLDGLPDLIVDTSVKGGPTTATLAAPSESRNLSVECDAGYAPNSVRHLLSRLLEIDPEKRITAAEALAHPWATLTFKSSEKNKPKNSTTNNNNSGSGSHGKNQLRASHATKPKQPSREAMEEAIQRDVAKRVLQSSIVKLMIKKDKERHLQFACDVAHILNIEIPSEVFKPCEREPFEDEYEEERFYYQNGRQLRQEQFQREQQRQPHQLLQLGRPSMVARGSSVEEVSSFNTGDISAKSTPTTGHCGGVSVRSLSRNGSHNTMHQLPPHGSPLPVGANSTVDGTVVSTYLPVDMPVGCVDASLFLPFEEEDYYEIKSGRTEFDVRALREYPLKLRTLREYLFNVVLVQCGYRTGPDPLYSIHSIGSNLNSLLRRSQSSSNNLPPPGSSSSSSGAVVGGGHGLTGANVKGGGAAVAGGGGTGAGHIHANNSSNSVHSAGGAALGAAIAASTSATAAGAGVGGGTIGSGSPPNASAIMGSVVIQTNRRNSLQGRRGLSTSRPSSPVIAAEAALPNRGSGSASNRRRRNGGGGVYDGAAAETDNAMRESSKCFCGLV